MIRLYQRLHYAFLIGVTVVVFRLLTRFTLVGRENVPPHGPLIVISNHLHYTDTGLVPASVGRKTHYLAKTEITQHPLAGFLARHFGAIPIDRTGLANRETIGAVLDLLSTDRVVGMFPEGTRSRSGGMARARPGAALLAVRSNAPILPVAVTGTDKFRWRTILWERPVIRVVIGAPFSLPVIEGTLDREQRQALADMMMQRVADLLPESYQGHYRPKVAGGAESAS